MVCFPLFNTDSEKMSRRITPSDSGLEIPETIPVINLSLGYEEYVKLLGRS